jgi:Crp-like helix-turn-helix protein
VVPLVLPHRVIAQLVGARRPTVSTALGRLAGEGTLTRLADGTWLLRGHPVGLPTAETECVVQLRAYPGAGRFDRGGPVESESATS